ncbi:MAG: hypothetical protein ABH875_04790 [Candidatus Omnitrophota bacterium]
MGFPIKITHCRTLLFMAIILSIALTCPLYAQDAGNAEPAQPSKPERTTIPDVYDEDVQRDAERNVEMRNDEIYSRFDSEDVLTYTIYGGEEYPVSLTLKDGSQISYSYQHNEDGDEIESVTIRYKELLMFIKDGMLELVYSYGGDTDYGQGDTSASDGALQIVKNYLARGYIQGSSENMSGGAHTGPPKPEDLIDLGKNLVELRNAFMALQRQREELEKDFTTRVERKPVVDLQAPVADKGQSPEDEKTDAYEDQLKLQKTKQAIDMFNRRIADIFKTDLSPAVSFKKIDGVDIIDILISFPKKD